MIAAVTNAMTGKVVEHPSVSYRNKNLERLHATISLAASGLKSGEQTRKILCPSCSGGRNQESSFSIRKEQDGTIKYKCFRASCTLGYGSISPTGSFIPPEDSLKPVGRRSRPFLGKLWPVPARGYHLFESKYGLGADDLDEAHVLYNAETDRYAFQVMSPQFMSRGMTLRSFDENGKYPKWDAYEAYSEAPWLGWYIRPWVTHKLGPVVVVEDPISALKVSRQYISTFLNGTNLDIQKLSEIMRVGSKGGVVFALDKDATAQAIEMVRRNAFFIGGTATCVQLEKDLKYSTDAEIAQIFGNK